jgi:hypothetical protein
MVFTGLKCTSEDWHKVKNRQIKLKASLNTCENLKLGDTLRLFVVIPDTIEVEDNLQNTSSFEIIRSLENADACLFVRKLDTLTKTAEPVRNILFNKEASNQACASFKKVKPFEIIIEIIPENKGFYYLRTEDKNSRFVFNNGKSRISAINAISIDAPDKRHQKIAYYLQKAIGISTEAEYYNAILQHELSGGSYYGFFVE